jgi:hypothetical protein
MAGGEGNVQLRSRIADTTYIFSLREAMINKKTQILQETIDAPTAFISVWMEVRHPNQARPGPGC